MVVFNLAIFAPFDDNSYSVQVPKTLQKEGIHAQFDSKILLIYFSHFPEVFVENILLNFENIAKTIMVVLEIKI